MAGYEMCDLGETLAEVSYVHLRLCAADPFQYKQMREGKEAAWTGEKNE